MYMTKLLMDFTLKSYDVAYDKIIDGLKAMMLHMTKLLMVFTLKSYDVVYDKIIESYNLEKL